MVVQGGKKRKCRGISLIEKNNESVWASKDKYNYVLPVKIMTNRKLPGQSCNGSKQRRQVD